MLAAAAVSCVLSADRRVDQLFEVRREGKEAVLEKAPLALDDPSASVRATATWMLGETGHPSVVPLLLGALSDPAPDVKGAALSALTAFCGNRAGKTVTEAHPPAAPDHPAMEPEASPAAAPRLPEADGGTAARIAREALSLARHPDPAVRYRVVVLLARCDPAGGVEALRNAAVDADPDVRGEALRALSESPVPPADSLPELTRALLADEEWKNRLSAVTVLSRSGANEALSLLAIARTDANPLVRAEAARAAQAASRWAEGHEAPAGARSAGASATVRPSAESVVAPDAQLGPAGQEADGQGPVQEAEEPPPGEGVEP